MLNRRRLLRAVSLAAPALILARGARAGSITLLGGGQFVAPAAFSPTSLFPANGGWWDVSDASTRFQDTAGTTPAASAGDPVGRLNDKSGNGNNLLQATAGSRPTLRNSGALWWLEFDGIDDHLNAAFTHTVPMTRINAAQQVTWGGGQPNLFSGDSGNTAKLVQYPSSPNIVMAAGALGPAALTDLSLAANHVITEIYNGASSKLGIDNIAYHTGDPSASNPNGLTVAYVIGVTGAHANMLWHAGIAIDGVMSDPNIALCKTFFGAKAGLSL